jgi:hypothetical protein
MSLIEAARVVIESPKPGEKLAYMKVAAQYNADCRKLAQRHRGASVSWQLDRPNRRALKDILPKVAIATAGCRICHLKSNCSVSLLYAGWDVSSPRLRAEPCAIVRLHLNPRPTHISRATLGITSSCFSPSQTSVTSFAHCQPSRTTMSRCVRSHRTAPLDSRPLFLFLFRSASRRQRPDFSEL